MHPLNAIAAATHPDPYPYYRQLLAGAPLHFDAGLNMWVASRADVIREVLANPQCQVRPSAEPIPGAIADSAAGEIFGRLIRMNEGDGHACGKRIVAQSLAALDAPAIHALTLRLAAELARHHDLSDGAALTRWIFELPTQVLARLLGIPDGELATVTAWTRQFVQCLSPLASAGELAEAGEAARALSTRFAALVEAADQDRPGLLGKICGAGWPSRDALVANLVGLLSQTHEATAGLVGNCIVRILTQPRWQAALHADPGAAESLVREVARCDPPVQNTRRFVGAQITVAGQLLRPGTTLLLVLAAAGHDQQDGFLPGFGHGRHACPGSDAALWIATAALSYLLANGKAPRHAEWRYRPSLNARLPLFVNLSSKEPHDRRDL